MEEKMKKMVSISGSLNTQKFVEFNSNVKSNVKIGRGGGGTKKTLLKKIF
jgi:hypothetical protein